MGPASILLRAPFAALARLGDDTTLERYRLGAFACLFVAALVVLWMAHRAGRRGVHPAICAAFAFGAIVNPLTFRSLSLGHPEEPLAAVLIVAAVVAAAEARALAAGLLFGLAMSTKQWALLAVGPVLLAAPPATRRTLVTVAAAVTLVLFAPLVFGDTERFVHATSDAASPTADATPTNVWWPLAETVDDPTLPEGVERREPPPLIRTLAHWLVLILAFGSAALVFLRNRHPGLSAALALAALVFLMRCVFDAYTFSYHHEPFLIALAAYEVVGRRRFPYLALMSGTVLWFLSYRVAPSRDIEALTSIYLGWALPMTALLAWLVAREVNQRTRTRSP